MATLLEGPWPYQREQPDLVVLGVEPGHAPSPLPPVRIFLGTEEGQYRAERVFVWSVLQVRDPARVYEIHLMKNVAGFDRRGWRTGFTCYRFAIPDFAGRTGKAIYNDVDQIYLADPALLFDLPLDGHGYLAIDARDTSVMLIDCERMLPWWNRAAASAHGAKGPLTAQAGRGAGPVGRAGRALERARPRICRGADQVPALHGPAPAALEPLPRGLFLSPEPAGLHLARPRARRRRRRLGDVHAAMRPAPASRPSWARTDRPRPLIPGPLLSEAAGGLLRQTGARSLLVTGIDGALNAPLGATELTPTRHDFARARGHLPEEPFDAVLAAGIFERIPGADANWVLRELFAAAGPRARAAHRRHRRRGCRQRGTGGAAVSRRSPRTIRR